MYFINLLSGFQTNEADNSLEIFLLNFHVACILYSELSLNQFISTSPDLLRQVAISQHPVALGPFTLMALPVQELPATFRDIKPCLAHFFPYTSVLVIFFSLKHRTRHHKLKEGRFILAHSLWSFHTWLSPRQGSMATGHA